MSFAQNHQAQGNNANGEKLPALGVISGTVLDSISSVPIEYANIVLFKVKDSTLINGVVTDEKGKFRIEKIPYGKYFIRINFIGYKTQRIPGVILKPDKKEIKLGNIKIYPSSTNLKGVTIAADKDQMTYNLDKKVINVDKSLVTAGGTAIDIMQTIPAITVDVDNVVSLRGSSNVTILIDGRPSGLTSLDQIPASMVERVEIVTNPSAKYDPDGMSGMINIVLKRKREPGYNGMISANAGTGDKYNSSINLNYRHRKINVFANYDNRFFSMKGYTSLFRNQTLNDTTTYLDQLQNFRRHGNFHNFKLGGDLFLNEFNTLSFSGLYQIHSMNGSDITTYASLDSAFQKTNYYDRSNNSHDKETGYEYALDYKKTFVKKNQELTANLFYSSSTENSFEDISQHYYNLDLTPSGANPYLQNSSSVDLDRRFTGQTDFGGPIGARGRIETGYKATYKQNDVDYLLQNYDYTTVNWTKDTSSSNHFVYTSMIHAAYFIYSNNLLVDSIKRFKYQLGGRVEEAYSISDQKTSQLVYKSDYLDFFPTAHVRFEFTETNALQLSYSRRVNRARIGQLNPFVNNTDPMNLSTGNPYLKPEYINSFELAHSCDIKKSSFTTTLFYRQIDNIISRIMTLQNNGTTFSTYKNMTNGISYGLEFIYAQEFYKWWKVNANFSYFKSKFNGSDVNNIQGSDDFSWNAKINNTMTILKNLDLQMSFNYTSPMITVSSGGSHFMSGGGQGEIKENYFADFGMKKEFLKGRIAVSLRMSDVFKTMKYDMVTYGENFTSSMKRRRQSRILFFGIVYKLNGGIKQKGRKKQDMDTDPNGDM